MKKNNHITGNWNPFYLLRIFFLLVVVNNLFRKYKKKSIFQSRLIQKNSIFQSRLILYSLWFIQIIIEARKYNENQTKLSRIIWFLWKSLETRPISFCNDGRMFNLFLLEWRYALNWMNIQPMQYFSLSNKGREDCVEQKKKTSVSANIHRSSEQTNSVERKIQLFGTKRFRC